MYIIFVYPVHLIPKILYTIYIINIFLNHYIMDCNNILDEMLDEVERQFMENINYIIIFSSWTLFYLTHCCQT